MNNIEFTKGVELIISMSTDFLLGNLDRETYSNNLSIYADYMKGCKTMPEKVRAKMICEETGSRQSGTHFAKFHPVTGTSEENEKFFKWTPCGRLELDVLNNQYFEVGKEYYIDIIRAVEEPVQTEP